MSCDAKTQELKPSILSIRTLINHLNSNATMKHFKSWFIFTLFISSVVFTPWIIKLENALGFLLNSSFSIENLEDTSVLSSLSFTSFFISTSHCLMCTLCSIQNHGISKLIACQNKTLRGNSAKKRKWQQHYSSRAENLPDVTSHAPVPCILTSIYFTNKQN